MKREKVRRNSDKKIFRKTAVRQKLVNMRKYTPRGGIRL